MWKKPFTGREDMTNMYIGTSYTWRETWDHPLVLLVLMPLTYLVPCPMLFCFVCVCSVSSARYYLSLNLWIVHCLFTPSVFTHFYLRVKGQVSLKTLVKHKIKNQPRLPVRTTWIPKETVMTNRCCMYYCDNVSYV
jgi:hypothetical protein